MHCPAALPSKDVFAQRKVPRPVSPLPGGGHGTAASRGAFPGDEVGSKLSSLTSSVSDRLAGVAASRETIVWMGPDDEQAVSGEEEETLHVSGPRLQDADIW